MNESSKRLLLGSAMWGWSVEESAVFDLISTFSERGGIWIDTAVNYPINKNPSEFGRAIQFISTWLARSGGGETAILVKVGAKENTGSDRSDLSPDALWSEVARLRRLLGGALRNVSIHWDNRGDGAHDRVRINETLSVLRDLHSEGLEIGLSGVRFPLLYREEAPDLGDKWWIQVKENVLTAEARERYRAHFPNAKYLAYGINMGGFTFDRREARGSAMLRGLEFTDEAVNEVRKKMNAALKTTPAPTTLHDFTLLNAYRSEGLSGVIVGPRTVSQLRAVMDYWSLLDEVNGAGAGI